MQISVHHYHHYQRNVDRTLTYG